MDLQKAKFEINQKLIELKKLLQVKDFELYQTEVDSEVHVNFHGYANPDAFENDLVDDHFGQLDEWIYLCYLNELDANKKTLLVESILERLTFSEQYTTMYYDKNIELLTQEQKELLNKFESIQWSIHKSIIEMLTEKYLSDVNSNKGNLARLVWNGNQTELAGLFYHLEKKGWLNIGLNKEAFYRTVDALFDVPGSTSLLKNFKDYYNQEKGKYGVFKEMPPGPLK